MIRNKHISIFIFGFWIFAFFLQYPFPVKFISILGLLCSSLILGSDPKLYTHIFGELKNKKIFFISMILCVIIGIIIAITLRNENQLPYFPKSYSHFAAIAILIGATEELIFRGWLQSILTIKFNYFSIPLSSLAHSIFKILIFVSPVVRYEIDLQQLLIYTFIGGIVLGFFRFWSGSIWPALTAHVLFDFILYGDVTVWPWWVS